MRVIPTLDRLDRIESTYRTPDGFVRSQFSLALLSALHLESHSGRMNVRETDFFERHVKEAVNNAVKEVRRQARQVRRLAKQIRKADRHV